MTDERKSREELIAELEDLRKRIDRGENSGLKSPDGFMTDMVEAATEGLALVDPSGVMTYVNAALAEMHGVTKDELVGKHFSQCYSEATLPQVETVREEAAAAGFFAGEIWRKKADGSEFPCHERHTAVTSPSGDVRGTVVAVRDITQRKKMEDEFWESESKYREIVQNANSIILRWTPDGVITFFNQYARTFFGYSEDEIIGRNMVGSIIPETDSSGHGLTSLVEEIRKRPEFYATYENENMRKNGERVWVAWTNKAIVDNDGAVVEVLSIGNDITDRKRMEQDLLEAKKLESLGILIGSIAHDYNNILTEVFGNIGAAKLYVDLAQNVFQRLSEVERASLRAKRLTSELLNFAKGPDESARARSIGALIEDSASFVLRGSNIVCDFSIQDDLWRVKFDEEMILQVLSTLIINAHQAMPEGGLLRVGAENTTISGEDNLPVRPGRYVKITVQDEGLGIPREILPNIFDPYFTTKRERTGLGLASVYSIVRKHRGHITVDSTEGVGTTFEIYLPAASEEAGAEEVEEKEAAVKLRALVIDDDEVSRTTAREFLTVLGHEAAFAQDGVEALDTCRKAQEAGQPFNLIIAGAETVKGGDGRESLRRLLEFDPTFGALLACPESDPTAEQHASYGFRGVVAKPFNIQDLSIVLGKLLGK